MIFQCDEQFPLKETHFFQIKYIIINYIDLVITKNLMTFCFQGIFSK